MISIRYVFSAAALALGPAAASAQLTINSQQTAQQIAAAMTGAHVTVTNPVLTCPTGASATFAAGPASSNLGMADGALFTTGSAASNAVSVGVNAPQSSFASTAHGAPGDATINALSGGVSYDACVFECDVKAAYDTLLFEYVFGSEEYEFYSCSAFNDAFGFFISGPGIVGQKNLALIPGTTIPVAINSTTDTAFTHPFSLATCQAMGNGSPFAQYYNDNSTDTTISYFGLTTVLTAVTTVDTSVTYHLKFAIADVSDGVFDAGVFIKGNSITSKPTGGFPTSVSGVATERTAVVPNPFSNTFTLRLPAAWKTEEVTATLADMTGRTVRSETATGTQLEGAFGESRRALSRGIYFLRLSVPRTGAAQMVKLEKL